MRQLWRRLLGRPASESGRLRQGAAAYTAGRSPPERANVAYALKSRATEPTSNGGYQWTRAQSLYLSFESMPSQHGASKR